MALLKPEQKSSACKFTVHLPTLSAVRENTYEELYATKGITEGVPDGGEIVNIPSAGLFAVI
jgi:hypothetical protein